MLREGGAPQVSGKARRSMEDVDCKNSELFLAALSVKKSHDKPGLKRQEII